MENITKPNPIGIKIIRAEKRKDKIIIVIKPDLLSNEPFAVTPFQDEGNDKNQLQAAKFLIQLTEENGEIKNVSAEYSGDHYTKGHSQLWSFNNLFLTKKDTAIAWALSAELKSINAERTNQVMKVIADDPETISLISLIIEERRKKQKNIEFAYAKQTLLDAIKQIETLLSK